MRLKSSGPLVVGMLGAVVGCGDAVEAPPPSNVFAARAGATVTASRRMMNPARVIDGSEDEANGTAFGEDGNVGDVVSVDIQTARRATASSFRLRAAQDGKRFLYRRSLNGFRLEADANGDGTYETLVIARTISTDYPMVPGNVAPAGSGELDLTVAFAPVTSRNWRFSATQGFDSNTTSDGPRIREIELTGTQ